MKLTDKQLQKELYKLAKATTAANLARSKISQHCEVVYGFDPADIDNDVYFDEDSGVISHKYVRSIPDQEQYAIFRDFFNGLNKSLKEAA